MGLLHPDAPRTAGQRRFDLTSLTIRRFSGSLSWPVPGLCVLEGRIRLRCRL